MGAVPNVPEARTEGLRAEALARLRAYRERPPVDRVPRYLLQLREDQRYAVVVDMRRARLYLYQNDDGRPLFVADYYVSSGKNGPRKSAKATRRRRSASIMLRLAFRSKALGFLRQRRISHQLPERMGPHSGPQRPRHMVARYAVDTYSRPPRASNGCVVLANSDLDALARNLQVGLTPVIISEDVEWLSLDDWAGERKAFRQSAGTMAADWESLDTERYLSHYQRGSPCRGRTSRAGAGTNTW